MSGGAAFVDDEVSSPAADEANRLMLESFERPDFVEGVQSFVEKREPNFAPVTSERAPA